MSTKTLTQEQWVERAMTKHNSFYLYDKSIYINSNTRIIITCPLHGDFKQFPSKHLSGQKCRQCHFKNLTTQLCLNTEKFIYNSRLIHGEKYNYSKVICTNQYDRVIIICPIHGEFEQIAKNHRRNGCKKCASDKMGWNTHRWLLRCDCDNRKIKLYYIRCWNEEEEFYKIGLTCRQNINERLNKTRIPYNYEILEIYESCNTIELIQLEQKLKRELIKYKYIPKIKFNGYTECFTGGFVPKFI